MQPTYAVPPLACLPASSFTPQARNKPIEPPKKPEAAPFFLPTLVGAAAGRNPVFDFEAAAAEPAADRAAEAALASKAAAAWGDDDNDGQQRPQNGAADAAGSSDIDAAAPAGQQQQQRQRPQGRIMHTRAQAEHSQLVRLLHSCSRAGDWTSLVAHLRGLPPVALDAEIRSMQVLEGAAEEEVQDVALLLSFLEDEVAANRNFEFMQALLRVTLQVHGETLAASPELQEAAQRTQQRLAATWQRLDGLLQSCRCMVGLLGNLQT